MPTFNNDDALQPVEVVGSNGAGGFNAAHVANNGSVAVADSAVAALLSGSSAGGQGNKVVAAPGTPVQLAAVATPCTMVIITARIGNTKQIAYGWSNTVRAAAGGEVGAQLQPGDSVSLKVTDLSELWIDAQVANEGVSFTYNTN